jgi:DNA-binding SARP family transcriptional activator
MDFRVLGALEVWSDGHRIALSSARHQRALAALLLTPNSVVPTARLIAAIWEDDPPATATKQVQNCISALRDRLGTGRGVIVTDGPGYRVKVGTEELDSLRFQHEFESARRLAADEKLGAAVATARQALRLWRGPAFDGLGAAALAGAVMRLNEQRTNAIELCVDWRLKLGEYRAVTEELTEFVAQHPFRERLHAQLMVALDASGRRADALSVFQELRARLVDELGVDPSAELQDLYVRILNESPGTALRSVAAGDGRGTHSNGRSPTPDQVTENLAGAIARQWLAEAEMRGLNRPEPVPVRWSETDRPVATASVTDSPGRDVILTQQLTGGDPNGIVADFRQLPSRQLVILGEPGAGKSVLAMLLTLGLLGDPRPGEPVPVLLPLASWNPHQQHFYHWLAGKLAEEYPGLANQAKNGSDAATRLVTDGKIIPVLDGLDETPPALHAAAIDALDQAVAGDRPLVVTCRSAEYERAVTGSGCVLARAAVVEIEEVELDAAIGYLTARTTVGDDRWQPVIAHLHRHPRGALAQALRTPLMIDLARTAYAHPDTTPAELCDTARFADAETVKGHLLDDYLPAAYARRQTPLLPPHDRRTSARTYEPARAARWLGFLAQQSRRQQTQDIAWWRLHLAAPDLAVRLYLGLPPAVLFATAAWLAAGPKIGIIYGLSFAVAGCLAHGAGRRPGPLRVELRFRGTSRRFLGRFLTGVVIGVGLGFGWSLGIGIICLLAVVFGLAIGLHVWLDAPVDVDSVSSPATVLRNDRTAALAFTFSFMASLGLFYGTAFATAHEVRFILILDGHFDVVLALAAGVASGLFGHFLLSKPGAIAYGLAGAVVGGQVFSRAASLQRAVTVGIVFGLAVGLTVCLSRAWGVFALTRIWLAMRGHLPLRLIRFLDDAHRRGIFRQVGAAYQFRHALLRDRLADQAGGTDRQADPPTRAPSAPASR